MELSMKAYGKMAKLMEEVNSGTQMGTYMMAIGKRTKLTVMGFIFMLMEQSMKVIGKLTFNMAKELKSGRMVQGMKENTKKD